MVATEDGKDALLNLAGGDLRRVLNLLQSCHMAYSLVDEQNIYLTAGAAVPAIINAMFTLLLNTGFNEAYDNIRNVLSHSSSYIFA